MARYIDADTIDYTIASVYWGRDKDGKEVYRRTAIATEFEIDEMPTADVAEVKYGEWVKSDRCNHVPYRIKNPEKWVMCRCSVCGYSNGRRISDNYCSNCGAKMDGGTHDKA